jgi:hypothetical protein
MNRNASYSNANKVRSPVQLVMIEEYAVDGVEHVDRSREK